MENTQKIYPRAIMGDLLKALKTDNALVLHGARQVGKTSLMRLVREHLEKQGEICHYIDLEDSRYVRTLDAGADEFLRYLREAGVPAGKKAFIFIDEIQYLKNPSSFLKLIADHHPEIRLIVSGSSSFAIKNKFKNSLAGRTLNFELFPLSFREFLVFRGFSPESKISGKTTLKTKEDLRTLFKEYALYGGYPKVVLEPDIAFKEKYLQQIIDTYIKKDIRDLANVKDIEKFNKLLEALAGQGGQMLNVMELSNTCNIARQTIEHYLFILENTYIIRLLRPYSRNIRAELFRTPKIYFYDSGIMQMLWMKQLQKEILGSVFETAIFMELAKSLPRDNIFYWRTKDQKEVDFIIRKGNSLYPLEAKLSFASSSTASLSWFCEKYSLKKYAITGLKGESEGRFHYYPWAIPGLSG